MYKVLKSAYVRNVSFNNLILLHNITWKSNYTQNALNDTLPFLSPYINQKCIYLYSLECKSIICFIYWAFDLQCIWFSFLEYQLNHISILDSLSRFIRVTSLCPYWRRQSKGSNSGGLYTERVKLREITLVYQNADFLSWIN